MKGVQFVVNEKGKRTGVVIDLREWRDLWEDIFDTALAKSRRHEPRESLDSVKRRLHGNGRRGAR